MRRFLLMTLILVLLAPLAGAQMFGGRKDESAAPRTLTGRVLDKGEQPVAGAIVSLKNMRTLAVVSFISEEDGGYRFHNLSPSVDYEVRAESQGRHSVPKTLSSFDTHKQAHITLKLDKEAAPKN